jgi:hypothetical protein
VVSALGTHSGQQIGFYGVSDALTHHSGKYGSEPSLIYCQNTQRVGYVLSAPGFFCPKTPVKLTRMPNRAGTAGMLTVKTVFFAASIPPKRKARRSNRLGDTMKRRQKDDFCLLFFCFHVHATRC